MLACLLRMDELAELHLRTKQTGLLEETALEELKYFVRNWRLVVNSIVWGRC